MRGYLKIFGQSSLLSGTLVAIAVYFLSESIVSATIYGVATGIILGFFLTVIREYLRRYYNANYSIGGLNYNEKIRMNVPYDRVFELCVESLRDMRCKIRVQDSVTGEVIGRTPRSWKSWGELILYKISSVENEGWEVEINCRPLFPVTMMDYGKNKQNIENVLSILRGMTMEENFPPPGQYTPRQ